MDVLAEWQLLRASDPDWTWCLGPQSQPPVFHICFIERMGRMANTEIALELSWRNKMELVEDEAVFFLVKTGWSQCVWMLWQSTSREEIPHHVGKCGENHRIIWVGTWKRGWTGLAYEHVDRNHWKVVSLALESGGASDVLEVPWGQEESKCEDMWDCGAALRARYKLSHCFTVSPDSRVWPFPSSVLCFSVVGGQWVKTWVLKAWIISR